jgi:O-antigen ligase
VETITTGVTADSPEGTAAPQETSLPLKLSYLGLVIFTIGYYVRPEDFLGGRYLPFAFVGGILAVGGYLTHLASGGRMNRPRETIILASLFCWLILSIPFATWVTGSLEAFKNNIAKVLLLTIVIANAISSLDKLRRLLKLQVILVAGIGWLAHYDLDKSGRVSGASQAFGNANDLAVLLCSTAPLLLYLLSEANGYLRKTFYAIALLLVFYTVILTYSRTGVLALASALVALAWHFGVKAGRHARVAVLGILLSVAFFAVAPSGYGRLIASIFSDEVDLTGTKRGDAPESSEARQKLLNQAVDLTIQHPIFGVGLNSFGDESGTGRAQHNTFLQYSSEAGIPALLLFLLLIRCTFVNLRRSERLSIPGSEVWRLAGALRASFIAFLVGAFFTNFGYSFFAYFSVGFAAALHQVAINHPNPKET